MALAQSWAALPSPCPVVCCIYIESGSFGFRDLEKPGKQLQARHKHPRWRPRACIVRQVWLTRVIEPSIAVCAASACGNILVMPLAAPPLFPALGRVSAVLVDKPWVSAHSCIPLTSNRSGILDGMITKLSVQCMLRFL